MKLLFLVLCLCFHTILSAQNTLNETDLIESTFHSFIHNYSEQKITLQTDRQIYITGERIWFKAMVVNSLTHKIDLTPHNVFADLVDDSDRTIAKLVLDNQQHKTAGAIFLPDTLKTGFYWLRSYTAAMLQQPESIYIQPIFVLNKNLHDESSFANAYSHTFSNKSLAPVIQFFPERLTGIPNIISTGVLKITDANNNPLMVNGTIISNDSVVTTFSTNHSGLARITFLNNAALKYTAVFKANNSIIQQELPPVNHHAAQLSIANGKGNNIKAFVTLEDSLPANFQTIVVGMHGDSLCYAAVGNGTYGTTISLDNFPGGIASLLLFDLHQHLLDERAVYIDKENYRLALQADKTNYAARENATLTISLTNAEDKPVAGSLNMAVQDAWLAQLEDSTEIDDVPPADKFLLGNWLTLHHYHLSDTALDMLMVTMKPDNKIKARYHADSAIAEYDDNNKILNLVGNITNKKNKPISNREITVIAKNSVQFFMDADTTKTDGSFKIALPQNMDSLSVSLQVKDKYAITRLDEHISIDSFTFPVFATPVSLKKQFFNYNFHLLTSLQKFYADTAITFQGKGWLKPIIVRTVEKEPLNYDASKRLNIISQILTSDKFKYGGRGAVTNALLTVPGISMVFGDISIFGFTPTMDWKGVERPLLVVDGIAMGNASIGYFDELQPADVDFIEVLRGAEAAIYGVRAGGGVISVNMRHGPPPADNSKSNFLVLRPVTYHVCPQFYMPDYAIAEIRKKQLPDPRTTIYWNGDITTDNKGKAVVHFYTADNATNYSVTVSGLTAKGELVYKRILVSRNE